MVSNYKKKPDKYREIDVQRALADYRTGKRTLRGAAKHYNIDKSYLSRRSNGGGIKKRGRKQVLSENLEQNLARCLKTMGQWGFGLSKEDAKNVVKEYVQQSGLETPFSSGKPGNVWFKNFQKRNGLSLKKPEQLEACRRKATSDPYIIYEFYDLLEDIMNKYDLGDKPSHIYNLDESGFSSDPSRVKVVSKKGEKVHRNIQGSGKENTTVLACVNASGKVLPPLIIFQGSNLWSSWKGTKDLPGTYYAVSEKGWMTTSIFNEYFARFCSIVKERPILLIFDGHLTHLDPVTIETAIKQNIIILKLPSHTTDLLQPLDKCCFKPLKLEWDKRLINWQMENQRKLTKSEFADLLGEVWHQGLKPETVISGFVSTGIHPVNRLKYPTSRFDITKLTKYRQEKGMEQPKENEKGQEEQTQTNNNGGGEQTRELLNEEASTSKIITEDSEVDLTTDGCLKQPTLQDQRLVQDNEEDEAMSSTEMNPDMSFENILLKKLKKTSAPTTPRRKVDTKAKVVTSEEFLECIRQKVNQKEANERKKNERKERKAEMVKKPKVKPAKKLPDNCDSDSEDSDTSWAASGESDGGDDYIGSCRDANPTELYKVENIKELKEGDFILAEFKGGKRNKSTYKYVCIVQNILGETDISVMAMNAIDTSHTVFKTKEDDISVISFCAVIGKLPPPRIGISGERVKYIFNESIDVNEY